MATLWIKEHERMPQMAGAPQIWAEPCLVEQAVSYTGTAGQSAAFNAQTKFITITSAGIFSYLVSANPTALTTSFRVAADQILTIAVTPGQKISAITNT
jgi:hypothetical protein